MLYIGITLSKGTQDLGFFENNRIVFYQWNTDSVFSTKLFNLLKCAWQRLVSKTCHKAFNFISVKKGFYHGSEGY